MDSRLYEVRVLVRVYGDEERDYRAAEAELRVRGLWLDICSGGKDGCFSAKSLSSGVKVRRVRP